MNKENFLEKRKQLKVKFFVRTSEKEINNFLSKVSMLEMKFQVCNGVHHVLIIYMVEED